MATIITLPQAVNGILTASEAMLNAEAIEAGALEGIAAVVLGERSRGRPDLPCLYIFAASANVQPTRMALREEWTMPLTVVCLVQLDEPEEGYLQSMDYASRARSVLLADRKLGLEYVNDVVSASFEPAYQTSVDNRTIYGAAATVNVRFTVYEGR